MNIGAVKLIVIFVATALVFIFLSGAIHRHNLPEVVVDNAMGGTIQHRHRASGNVRVTEHDEIIANEEGIITLHVSEGDRVYEGQLLYSIVVDIRNLEDRIRTLEHNRDTQNVQIMRINNDINHRQSAGVRAPARAPLSLIEHDADIENINVRIRNAEDEYARLQSLYDIGATPRANLDGAVRELQMLNDQLNLAIERRQNAIDRYEDERIRDADTYDQAVADNARILADLNFQLQSSRLALESINNEIYRLNNQLFVEGIYEYRAQTSGEIIRIHEAARGGRHVFQNAALMSVRPDEAALYAVFNLPNNIDFVELGQRVSLNIRNRRNIAGIVDNIRFYYSHFEVYVSFESDDIQIGERAETIFEQTSQLYQRTLPNSAIREAPWDDNVTYVYVIVRDRGLFGYIYSVRGQLISIQEEGSSRTAIHDGFPGDLDVVIGSSQTISYGTRVRITPTLQ